MSDGRLRADWQQTSALMALIANCHRDPKARRRPFTPAEFDPFAAGDRRHRRRIEKASFADIKALFRSAGFPVPEDPPGQDASDGAKSTEVLQPAPSGIGG